MSKLKRMPRLVPKRREKIFVAVPTLTNTITVQLAGFIDACRRAENHPDGRYKFHVEFVNGFFPVHYARNWLVGKFLETDYSRLWFFDDDMLPEESAADLLNVDADICAGKMFRFDHADPSVKRLPGISICAGRAVEGDPLRRHAALVPKAGDPVIQDVDVVGTASMVIRREVLADERMWLPGAYEGPNGEPRDLYEEKGTKGWCPAVFRTLAKPNGQSFKGEDFDFCERAKALGYSVKVHLGAEVGHHKTINLDHVVAATHVALEKFKAAEMDQPFEKFYRREVQRCLAG